MTLQRLMGIPGPEPVDPRGQLSPGSFHGLSTRRLVYWELCQVFTGHLNCKIYACVSHKVQ